MTTINQAGSTALLLLRQANTPASALGANFKATVAAMPPSGYASAAKLQVNSSIQSALLDIKQANDSIVSGALEFLDSGNIKSNDPSVTDTIKQIISNDGDKFAALVKAEKTRSPAISDDNAIANAIQKLIRDNRSQFGDDEFVIGFKLSSGASIIANIEDVDGKSTSNTLRSNVSSKQKAYLDAIAAFQAATKDSNSLIIPGGASLRETAIAMATAQDAAYDWTMKWYKAFGFDRS